MKKIVFLLSVFLSSLSYTQNGQAYYQKQLESSTDSIDDGYMRKALKSLQTRQYKLMFNNTEAVYDEVKGLDINQNPVVEAFVQGISEFSGKVYFNLSKKIILNKKVISDQTFLIEKKKIDWILSKDTLKIDNYLCYKATTTRVIENAEGIHKLEVAAWYAPDIPLPYGPDGYGGLPGLILQLNNNGTITSLKRIEFMNHVDNLDVNFKVWVMLNNSCQ